MICSRTTLYIKFLQHKFSYVERCLDIYNNSLSILRAKDFLIKDFNVSAFEIDIVKVLGKGKFENQSVKNDSVSIPCSAYIIYSCCVFYKLSC